MVMRLRVTELLITSRVGGNDLSRGAYESVTSRVSWWNAIISLKAYDNTRLTSSRVLLSGHWSNNSMVLEPL